MIANSFDKLDTLAEWLCRDQLILLASSQVDTARPETTGRKHVVEARLSLVKRPRARKANAVDASRRGGWLRPFEINITALLYWPIALPIIPPGVPAPRNCRPHLRHQNINTELISLSHPASPCIIFTCNYILCFASCCDQPCPGSSSASSVMLCSGESRMSATCSDRGACW